MSTTQLASNTNSLAAVDDNWNYRFILVPEQKLLKDPTTKDYCAQISVGSHRQNLVGLPVHNEIVIDGKGFTGMVNVQWSRSERADLKEIECYHLEYDEVKIESEWTEKWFDLPLHAGRKAGTVGILIQRTKSDARSEVNRLSDWVLERIMLEKFEANSRRDSERKRSELERLEASFFSIKAEKFELLQAIEDARENYASVQDAAEKHYEHYENVEKPRADEAEQLREEAEGELEDLEAKSAKNKYKISQLKERSKNLMLRLKNHARVDKLPLGSESKGKF